VESKQAQKDADDLKGLGYAQELLREMGGFSSFAVSFSVISILTGATQLYGYGLAHGGPLQLTLGWIIVSIGTLCVALSMAELASAYPTAGASYHWSHIWGGRGLGWATASLNTIGQFAIMAGIDYGLTQFLIGLFHLPATPLFSFALYSLLLFSHAIFNHMGIGIVAFLNDLSAWYHIIVVVLLIGLLSYAGLQQPVSFLTTFHQTDSYPPLYSFLIGLLLAQWTLTGYDASAHVTEETMDPRRKAPWGIFLSVVVSIVAGFLMLVFVTLSIPDLNQALAFGDGAFIEILKLRLGEKVGTVIVALVAGAMWLCGLAAMTSASRMIYAFARDHGLPFSSYWAKVSPKHRTPARAIWGLVGLALLLAFSVKIYSAIVSVATISLYFSYGIPICARAWRRITKGDDTVGPWNIGKWSLPVSIFAVIWILFITVVFVLPPNEQAGVVMLFLSAFLLFLWFLKVGRRFVGPNLSLKEGTV
jgi:amino acid transporter